MIGRIWPSIQVTTRMATPRSAVMASIRTIWRWRYSPTRVFDRQPTTAQSPTSPISTVEPPPD